MTFVPTIPYMFDRPSTSAGDNDPKYQADEISKMIRAWSEGDIEAADRFMPVIYEDLRRQAHRYLNRERANHTLQTTALVHEAYLRLLEQKGVSWQNRSHFIALAAQMMRRILVNYAINRNRRKRGGSAEKVELTESIHVAADDNRVDLIMLNNALNKLEGIDERLVRIVELRFFGGMTIEETAEVVGISAASVKREWNMARVWLRSQMVDPDDET